jgi:hypothetical protein
MFKTESREVDGQTFYSSEWICDKCGEKIEFADMISVIVRDHERYKDIHREYHSKCIKDMTIREMM